LRSRHRGIIEAVCPSFDRSRDDNSPDFQCAFSGLKCESLRDPTFGTASVSRSQVVFPVFNFFHLPHTLRVLFSKLHLKFKSHFVKEIKVAINGFGRIGRTLTRILQQHPDIRIHAVNDLADAPTLAHLLKYDSIHGRFPGDIEQRDKCFFIDDRVIQVYNEDDPASLPWYDFDIDVVIEATGKFKSTEKSTAHLQAGAKKVIISAPPEDTATKMVVIGINDHLLDGSEKIVSNASCTTNSVAPLIKVLQDNWGIEQAYITTVHSYTSDQKLHDAPHRDWRRGRAAAQSIVPTTTGAAKAITRIFPELNGRLGGAGIRVPVPNGSLTDLSCILHKEASPEEINAAFLKASEGELRNIMEYTSDPIVSIDIIGNPHSCIFDSKLTSALGKMVKVVGWYDNEWGYSSRLVDLIRKIA